MKPTGDAHALRLSGLARALGSATTSGSGCGVGGWGATVLPAAVLRLVSLRSSSLRSAAGQTVGEVEHIPWFFHLDSCSRPPSKLRPGELSDQRSSGGPTSLISPTRARS